MTIGIIITGGSGHRMGQDIPKQFINVYDKPVIIYTLEGFQRHPQIDAIEVVCIDGWHDVLWAYAKQFNITKLKWVISGGETGQESIRNGVFNLEDKCNSDDMSSINSGSLSESYVISLLNTMQNYADKDDCSFSTVADVVGELSQINEIEAANQEEYEKQKAELQEQIDELEETIEAIYDKLEY